MDMYDYGYLGETSRTSSLAGSLVQTIIAVVLAVIGGIALYFTVFSKNNEKKYTGFMAKLYEWFQFKYFVIDDLFRMVGCKFLDPNFQDKINEEPKEQTKNITLNSNTQKKKKDKKRC